MKITMLAIDLAKKSFHLFGCNKAHKPVIDKSLKRKDFIKFMSQLPRCQIFMESCGGSNHWARKMKEQGHEVKLISPQHVKPFVGVQKNDRNDARAILEASRRLNARFVAVKSTWHQDLQSLHRIRNRLVRSKTSISNQLHGILLEYGIVAPTNRNFKTYVLECLEDASNELTPLTRETLREVYEEYTEVEKRVEHYTKKLENFSSQNDVCERLQELKGVGPLTATAFVASIANPNSFKNGRQVSAWLGLVPKQHSTGGRTKLRGITKTGDSYLRQLVIHGARAKVNAAVRRQYPSEEDIKIREWVANKGMNKTSVALANKNVRMMWAFMR